MTSVDESSQPSSSQASGIKRRPLRSCDVCRQRKSDGPPVPNGQCTNCLTFGNSCTYAQPMLKRGPKNRLVDELRRKNALLEAKLRSLSVCALCSQPLHSQPSAMSSSTSASTFQKTTLETQSSGASDPEQPSGEENEGLEIGHHFCRLSISTEERNFFGPSSSLALVGDAMAVKEKHLGRPKILAPSSRLSLYWQTLPWEKEVFDQIPHYVYPPNDLIDSLLELYFTNVHPMYPLLHRPSFERSVEQNLHLKNPKFGAVLLAVLAVASRWSNDPRVLVDGKSSLSSGWKFVTQVQVAGKHFDPTIYEVQFYGLMIIFSLGTSTPRAAWMYLALGVRFLQQRGEHRGKQEGDKYENMLGNRIFWSFFILDGFLCAFSGRPPALHVEDYDVVPPQEVDDEFWEEGFTQPLGKPSRLSFFVHIIRLYEILGDALRRLYASTKWKVVMGWIGPEWEQATVAELDSAMNDFLDSVPPHLRWDPDQKRTGLFFHQSAVLYMTYYYTQIIIHRPYIRKPTLLAAPSLSICITAARAALHVADAWLTNGVCQLPFPHIQTPVFVSAVILLMNIFGSRRVGLSIDNGKDLAQVEKAVEILNFGASRWQTAGRLRELILELQSMDYSRPREGLHWAYGGASGLLQPNVVLKDSDPTCMTSEGNPVPSADFPGDADENFEQFGHPFEPGTSIEQLLANTHSLQQSDPKKDWTTSEQENGILDDEIMSIWMAVPTDFTNMAQWDAYIENMNAPGTCPESR
ncbi:fungal-specific transcription factor domain-containing protein [Mycena galericulata]|nr:fungal-specific transcription factor domain-containing protein [Mycena galericulata]